MNRGNHRKATFMAGVIIDCITRPRPYSRAELFKVAFIRGISKRSPFLPSQQGNRGAIESISFNL